MTGTGDKFVVTAGLQVQNESVPTDCKNAEFNTKQFCFYGLHFV